MSVDKYKSSVQVPVSGLISIRERAEALQCDQLQLVRIIMALNLESGTLPGCVSDINTDEIKAPFPFALSSDFVEALGGRDKARDYVRWAIVEGLDKSPLAPPGD